MGWEEKAWEIVKGLLELTGPPQSTADYVIWTGILSVALRDAAEEKRAACEQVARDSGVKRASGPSEHRCALATIEAAIAAVHALKEVN